MTSTILLDLDSLIASVEHARATRPSRRVESAYEWLCSLEAVEFDADGCLIVRSATWSNTRYAVNHIGCSCPARKPCWHQEAWNLVQDAQRRNRRAVEPRAFHHIVSYSAAQVSGLSELF